ncbi:MAG TPA: hypothetical protein PLM76_11995 [Tenuifilaceae bacterium]|nr:hypothetical protein [Tenuifilaceae bacterium]
MKTRLVVISFFLFSQVYSFAQDELYNPRPFVIPVHDSKNQLHLSTGYSFSIDKGGVDANLSYSISSRIAVFGSVTYNPFSFKRNSSGNFFDRSFHYDYNNLCTTFGAEYFKTWPSSFVNILEAQLGFGYSKYDRLSYATIDGLFDERTEYNYSRTFFQVSASKILQHFELSLALRATFVNFGDYKWYEISGPGYEEDSQIESKFYVEPLLGGSYLIRKIKINLQAGGFMKKYQDISSGFETYSISKTLFLRIAIQYNFLL